MYQRNTIAVVMPCFNEEGKIGSSVARLRKLCKGLVDAVVVVDDGSSDLTVQEAKKSGAVVLSHVINQGAGAACRTGFFYTLEKKFDITILMAGDDQDDPKDIKALVMKLVGGDYTYVHGSRWTKGGKRIRHPVTRSFLTRFYSAIFSVVSGYPATDATNGMRAFRTTILSDPRIQLKQQWLNRYELEPYLFYTVIRLGYKVGEIAVTKKYHKEMKLNTKMVSIKSWWSILRPLVLLPLGIKS
jgi:dolichol-phosphate mannosyltransferase